MEESQYVSEKFSNIEKRNGEVNKNLFKMLMSAIFKHLFLDNRLFTRNATKSFPDVNFQFCFRLQQLIRCNLYFLYQDFSSKLFVTLKECQG